MILGGVLWKVDEVEETFGSWRGWERTLAVSAELMSRELMAGKEEAEAGDSIWSEQRSEL